MRPTPLPMIAESACIAQDDARAIDAETAAAMASLLKALAEPLRLRMLSFIATTSSGEACVCDLSALADVSQPTVSHHLKVLRDVGVVTSQRRGTWVWYSIAPGFTAAVATVLESFGPVALGAALVESSAPR